MIRQLMVVDNNPLIVKMLERFFQDEGYVVRTASDGLAALKVLDEFLPDVVFVDLIMPNISGDKLCRVIRATPALRDVRLVVLSAVVADEDVDFRAFGADACIAKGPFARMKENIRSVLEMLDRRTGLAQQGIVGREQLYKRGITRELMDLTQYFDVILRNMSDGVIQISRGRQVVFVNRAAMEIIGLPEEKILSSDFVGYFESQVGESLRDSLESPPRKGEESPATPEIFGEEREIFIGSRQVLLVLLAPVGSRDESRWLVIQDITERKRNEELLRRHQQQLEEEIARQTAELAQGYHELQEEVERRKEIEAALQASHDELEHRVAARTAEVERLYQQLLHSEKLRAVGKLAASIAHEFNNPICGIRNVLEGLQRRLSLTPADGELVAMAVRECDRVARLTSDLQSFNRPTSARLETLDVHAALADILLLCKKDLQNSKVLVQRDFSPDLPPVRVVADQLKQVFLNLLTNAMEAMVPGGGAINIATRVEGGEVIIRFCDTGSGINRDDLPHIFEPFFSTKSAVKGTGLGLPVSYGIIERHNGRLTVESEPGKGARFSVCLPPAEES